MKEFEIIFYTLKSGEKPVQIFLDSLDVKMRAKLAQCMAVLQEKGNELQEPYSKALGDGLFELRAKCGSNISRILYFFVIRKKDCFYKWLYKKNTKYAY